MGAAGLLLIAAALAGSGDWARIEGASGPEGQRYIHAIKGPPVEEQPGQWRIEIATVYENAPDTDLAIDFGTIRIDCARRLWKVTGESTLSAHGVLDVEQVPEAGWARIPAQGPIPVYRAAICDRVRGPLKKFEEFDPDDGYTGRYFMER
jgi:hypothetical protein